MLPWDGSYLGEFKTNIITKRIKFDNINFFLIKLNINIDLVVLCRFIRSNNKIPCIIDEIKPIFGINKIGTHSIKIGKVLYIIYKTQWYIKNNEIEIEMGEPLNRIEKNEQFIKSFEFDIKSMFAFRDLLGLDCFESSIYVDTNTKKIFPLKENKTKGKESTIIDISSNMSISVSRRWFNKNDLNFYINYISGNIKSIQNNNFTYNPITETFMKIHNYVYNVVFFIDKNEVWIINYITTRLRNYLGE